MDRVAYKVLTEAQYAALQAGRFEGAPVDVADGYVHLSTAGQLIETVRRHFAGQSGLVIAAVDLAPLGGLVRWEVSRGGMLFPHLYGRLEPAHIAAACPLRWTAEGHVTLPEINPVVRNALDPT